MNMPQHVGTCVHKEGPQQTVTTWHTRRSVAITMLVLQKGPGTLVMIPLTSKNKLHFQHLPLSKILDTQEGKEGPRGQNVKLKRKLMISQELREGRKEGKKEGLQKEPIDNK